MIWHTSNCQLIVWYIFYCWRLNFLWTNFWFLPNSKKVRETWAPYTYGPTLKNFTLTFLPKFFSRPLNMYWKSPRKFGQKIQCKIFHGRPVLLGHVIRETLKKCRKWHILLNMATRGCPWVKFKLRHASTLCEGHLGQRWRIPIGTHFFSHTLTPGINN